MIYTRKLTALLLTAVAVFAVALTALTGAGTAEARWQNTPRIGVAGEEIWTVSDNGRCAGMIHAGLQNDPAKPGWVRLSLRSKGFNRNNCTVTVKFVFHNVTPPFNHERFVRVRGSLARNTLLAQKDFYIGSGVDLVSVGAVNPASKNVSYYIAIP